MVMGVFGLRTNFFFGLWVVSSYAGRTGEDIDTIKNNNF